MEQPPFTNRKLDQLLKPPRHSEHWIIESADFSVHQIDHIKDGKIFIRANSLRVAVGVLGVYPSESSACAVAATIEQEILRIAAQREISEWAAFEKKEG